MTTVKFFDSTMVGAPVLNGLAGTMLNVLDACLVNGWGSATITSLTIASEVATVQATGHPFRPHMVTSISGSTISGAPINGEFKVLTTTANSYTFSVPGRSDQTATGVISHKVAPCGWTRPYSGTNKAVYRNDTVNGTGSYLLMDDATTISAAGYGYESMSDVSTGIGQFPRSDVQSTTRWTKASAADGSSWNTAQLLDGLSTALRLEPPS